MNTKNINFDNKKISKNDFYKNKLFQIDDIDINKILVSKKEPLAQRMHLNTLLDTTMMLLDHYL